MAQLRPDMHSLLNEYVIRLLKKNNIDTLADFMREDENKLMKIMNIDGSELKNTCSLFIFRQHLH